MSTTASARLPAKTSGGAVGWLCAGLVIAALLALPFVGNSYLLTFGFAVLIAYILGQSWDWVAGEMGYVNLGHYIFYGFGAYAFSIALVSAGLAGFRAGSDRLAGALAGGTAVPFAW